MFHQEAWENSRTADMQISLITLILAIIVVATESFCLDLKWLGN
jgi:hypothetical protein